MSLDVLKRDFEQVTTVFFELYDQLEVDSDVLPKEQSQWLKENTEVVVMVFDGNPLGVELPPSIELEISDTTPQAKGTTATNQLKEATVETGLRVQVPLFINPGDRIKIDTRTGKYVSRV